MLYASLKHSLRRLAATRIYMAHHTHRLATQLIRTKLPNIIQHEDIHIQIHTARYV